MRRSQLHPAMYAASHSRLTTLLTQYTAASFSRPDFPAGKSTRPGYDPIMGVTGKEAQNDHRFMSGIDPNRQNAEISFPVQFIESSGGEYFFVPSISTLRDRIGA